MIMKSCKKILHGVSDYAEMRRSNGYFIDRTDFIRNLESVRCAMFMRHRRFGKALPVSILQAYYDVNYADRFDELFSSAKIGENPAAEHNNLLAPLLRHEGAVVAHGHVAALLEKDFQIVCVRVAAADCDGGNRR